MGRAFIAMRVGGQVILVIIFGRPEVTDRLERRLDFSAFVMLLGCFCYCCCDLVLLVVMEENSRAILRASVASLSVEGRGIVHSVEEVDQFLVLDDTGIELDLDGFRMASSARTHLLVSRIGD